MWYKSLHRKGKGRLRRLASSLVLLPDNGSKGSLVYEHFCGEYLRKEYKFKSMNS